MTHNKQEIKKMLPKTYLRKHVVHEIDAALTHFKGLVPRMGRHVYDDSRTKTLMSLSGTIRVMFRESAYNIPICVWLEESYPKTAPICYVRPTREMMILRGKYISGNGKVRLPYLQEWKHGECDLVSLLQVMVAMFGESPPICMKPHPEPEQSSCWLQFHRQAEVRSKSDGSLYLSLARENGQPVEQENETNC